MAPRDPALRSDAGFSLPVFDRIAPPPPPQLLAARIEALTRPGDIVLDVASRGGWTARAALEQQRRAVLLESDPLTRLLAEVVLRPPDVRHLDAAFQAIGASPRRQSSLKVGIDELFATRCPRCGRTSAADEYVWETTEAGSTLVRKHYRCLTCRDQVRGGEQRHAPVDEEDVARAGEVEVSDETYGALRDRFATPPGDWRLPDELLGLHTPRQLVGLHAIVERIDGDLRAPQVEAALRLALVHAVLPASRLNGFPGRVGSLRISGGRVRRPATGQWRERNPWVAFEDAYRIVRGFVQRIEGSATALLHPRFGEDVRSLTEGATSVVRLATDDGLLALADEARSLERMPDPPQVRLVLGLAPVRANTERLSLTYLATCWGIGRHAASLLPLEPLFSASARVPWGRHAATIRRHLAAAVPLLGRDGRAVIAVDQGGADGLVATALGAVGAGYRLASAHLPEAGRHDAAVVELVPPGAAVPPGPRTRANVPLPPVAGGAGDPDLVPGRGVFSPPERYDQRPFTDGEVGRTVTETVVAVLQARGEPAPYEQILGEVLVALDRAGQLRALIAGTDVADPAGQPPETDVVERLLAAVQSELERPGHRRIVEVEPGRWWLVDRDDRAGAAPPLGDRVEWAVFSLLTTAGTLSEAAFRDRLAHLFGGHDAADDALVDACLASYRSASSTRDRVTTDERLTVRGAQHAEVIGLLADLGHRFGMSVAIARREREHRVRGHPLAEWLDRRELEVHLPLVHRAPVEELDAVDCIWYVRSKGVFMFEVEWTAMLAEPILRRHVRIPSDEHLVRFLVVAPERADLVRFKLERSSVLRDTVERDNWHILTWDRLGEFAARPAPALADLEPYLGLGPTVANATDQLPLFEEWSRP